MGLGGSVEREPLSTLMRRHLAARLAREVDRRGIVVWVDPHREYDGVAEALCPPQAGFVRWQGSWYRLRRALDEQTSGAEPPRLVIYQPVATPPEQEDPLAEVRLGGAEFQYRLGTLVRDALAGRLSPQRVEQLTRAHTLEEAEAALAAGGTSGVRLPLALGTGEPREMVLRLLADPDVEARLGKRGLWEEAREVLRHLTGAALDGEGPALRRSAFRHLVLVELVEAGWQPPFGIATQVERLTPEQRGFCLDVLRLWRSDPRRCPAYQELAEELGKALLDGLRSWSDAFADLDTLPVLDHLAFDAAVRCLREGRSQEAVDLAQRRRGSIWRAGGLPGAASRQAAWKALEDVARLLEAVEGHPVPQAGGADELLAWYTERGWQVDRAHRLMEVSLTELSRLGDLEGPVSRARGAYEAWLERLLEQFAERIAATPWQPRLLPQWGIQRTHLTPAEEPTAYVLVDALRYELGRALAEALEGTVAEAPVAVVPAVATPPTVTAMGMASLLPGADRGLKLAVAGGRLEVSVDGTPVRDVPDRVALLRVAHGEVVDLTLDEVLRWSEGQLRQRIGGARLVLVRAREIDDFLEGNHVLTLLRHLGGLMELLVKAVGRLSAAGVGRFLVTGDHGFLLLSRPLPASRLLELPGGDGVVVQGRCWVGRGGVTPSGALRLPLSHFGVAGDVDIVVPKGLGGFRTKGYLHGGLSPQELVVPVIALRTQPSPPAAAHVAIEVVGGRIATGIFNVVLRLEPDLFTAALQVHVAAQGERAQPVARPIAGQGYHEESGTVELSAQATQRIVTFRVTTPLRKGSRVALVVHDLGGRQLGRTQVPVVADVEVEA